MSCTFCDGGDVTFTARIVRKGEVLPFGLVLPCRCATDSAHKGGDSSNAYRSVSPIGVGTTGLSVARSAGSDAPAGRRALSGVPAGAHPGGAA